MDLPLELLKTLAAVVDAGTLERAARDLQVTPSAVSQRLRAIEQRVGRVILQRTKPVRPTAAGEALVRLARQLTLLEYETREILGDAESAPGLPQRVRLAANADSLITWFLPALADVASTRNVVFEVHREDQDRTAQLLEAGVVMGAVTAQRKAVAGCVASPLGRMRYAPIATAAFAERWFPDGARASALERAPIVDFDAHDTLQTQLAKRLGARKAAPRHIISASAEFAEAVRLGLGWGMLLGGQYEDGLADGSLVRLSDEHVDVPLWWQRWNLASPLLDRVSEAVAQAAGASAAMV